MERYQTQAVALTSRNLGEADRIIEYVTRDYGRLSVVARGARRSRKRFGGRLEKFVCVDLTAVERRPGGLCRLDEVRVSEYFAGLSADLDRISMAEALLELVGRFAVPGNEGCALFDELLESWRAIERGDVTPAAFYLALIMVVRQQGLLAELDTCVACGKPYHQAAFAPGEGGMVCRDCDPGRKSVSAAAAVALRALGRNAHVADVSSLAAAAPADELRALAHVVIEWHGGGPLRALRVWEDSLLNR